MQVLFFAVLVVAGVGVLMWSLRASAAAPSRRQRKLVRANLGPAQAVGEPGAPDLRQVVLTQPVWTRVGAPAVAGLADLARKVTPSGVLESLDRRRRLAGAEAKWSTEQLLATKVLLGLVGAFLGVVVIVSSPSGLSILGALLFTFCGFFGPDAILDARARERQRTIERDFPNALDQITICVEAGLGLDAAIAHAARSGSGPLADELSRLLQDIQVGVARQTALEALAERTDVADIRHFVVAIGQATRYGVPVAQALRTQSAESRERRRTRAEERAGKMAVKLLFPLIFCILPALFVVLLGPAVIRFADLGLTG